METVARPARSCKTVHGFTLVELMVTIALLAMLIMLAVPSFTNWAKNNQIRSTAESLQNGLRTAKARAINLNRQVVFTTTNATPGGDAAAAAGGLNWSVQLVPFTVDAALAASARFLEGGNFASSASDLVITGGPSTLCFNSQGRMVANTNPSVTLPACTLPAPPAQVHLYTVSRTGAIAGKDRPLAVLVSVGGQIRMCDPARTFSSTIPDGCP